MKAKFIGDPSQPDERLPDNTRAFGIDFPRDKFVEVKDEAAQRKVVGNSHFEIQGKAPEPPSGGPAPAPAG